MKLIKRIFRLTPMLITWAMLGVLFWGFVFTRITDTDRAHKIVLCVDAQVPGAAELETRMTGLVRDPIRLVRVEDARHIFTHVEWHMIAYSVRVSPEIERADPRLLFVSDEDLRANYALPSAFSAYTKYGKN